MIVAKELVNRPAKINHIPGSRILQYAAVVLKKYRKSFEKKKQRKSETGNTGEGNSFCQ
jgi:hypothetical protein